MPDRRRRRSRPRATSTRSHGRGLALATSTLALVTLVASLLVVQPPSVAAQVATGRPIPDPLEVTLTARGFVPDRITVVEGQTIVILNDAGATRRITSGGDGTFDSGAVAVGSHYVLAFPTEGGWIATDDATPTPHTATITVGRLQLEGDQFTPANSAIPDLSPPDGPVQLHTGNGLEVTRNRILVSFTDAATVPQANAALAAAGLTIVGGVRDSHLLVTEVADAGTADLDYMQDALDTLRAQPGVRAAAYDVSLDPSSLPRPAVPDPTVEAGSTTGYTWDALYSPADEMLGLGLNYGLESARFPQAWNWLDAIRRVTPVNAASSSTVVLDGGFDRSHPDLAHATLQHLCTDDGRCTNNRTGLDADDVPRSLHGNAVAGIIGAAYDRDPPNTTNSPTSQGMAGGDPLSELHLVPYFSDSVRDSRGTVSITTYVGVIQLILEHKGQPPYDLANLRVINLSAGPYFETDSNDVPVFQNLFGEDKCGPGADDDATTPIDQGVWCTPNNKDSYLREFRAVAEIVRPLAPLLAANNVLLVVAAGNDGTSFCADRPIPVSPALCTNFFPIETRNIDPFGWLESIWTPGVPPWLTVEANLATIDRYGQTDYSNLDAAISAPGTSIAPFVDKFGEPTYIQFDGTSAAAPFVSAAAGLLSSLTPSWQTVRGLLVDRATDDLPEPAAPRLDVFASLLGLPAINGIDALLDVNDTSPDGNRRVAYDDRGQPTGEDRIVGSTQLRTEDAAPDGRIDMRDFRRYRDAWLQTCDGQAGCPAVAAISLDGAATHPKKDLNLDGCFLGSQAICPVLEGTFSRVDFNGDGLLLADPFPVLINAAGEPVARGSASEMTDLDVFQTRFGEGPNADTEGWSAADLDALMTSADVELRLDHLWESGVESAEVTVATVTRTGPRRTFEPRGTGDVRIYSVPIDPIPELADTDLVQVRVIATLPGGSTVTYLSPPIEAKAGEDIVVRTCTDQLIVEADQPEVTPGGSTPIEATLTDCTGVPQPFVGIDFEITAGPDGSSISVVNAFTDAQGIARTTFTYPDGVNSAAQVVARGYPALDGGERLERFVDLGPADDVVVHYRFRQTILGYERTSTNDWGPGEDDCDGPNDAGSSPADCFAATQTIAPSRSGAVVQYCDPFLAGCYWGLDDVDVGLGVLERSGTISPNGSGGVVIDEEVSSQQPPTEVIPPDAPTQDFSGIELETSVEEWDPADPAVRTTHHYTSTVAVDSRVGGSLALPVGADLAPVDLSVVDMGVSDARVQVNNLRDYRDVYAVEQYLFTADGVHTVLPPETNPDLPLPVLYAPNWQLPTDLALVPRLDGSNLQWADNPDAPLTFAGTGGGTYEPVSWCSTRQRLFDNGADPGYWSDTDPPFDHLTLAVEGDTPIEDPLRDPDVQLATRGPGARAAPRHTGSVTSRFEFVAVVTRAGDPVPDLDFESCSDSEPTPLVGYSPAAPVEGQPVDFVDVSSYAAGAMGSVWRFGDPIGATSTDPQHTFSDNGTYVVDFTTTDAGGAEHDSESADVVVTNAPPTLEVLGFGSDGHSIQVRVDDPGLVDRQQLEVRLTSPTPGWPAAGVTAYTSPPPDPGSGGLSPDPWTHTVQIPDTLTPGVYFVVLSVLDKDGGKATATFSLAVATPSSGDEPPAGFRSPQAFRSPAAFGSPAAVRAAQPTEVPAAAAGGPTFVGQLAALSSPPTAPVPAFVIDAVAGATGDVFTVRNATRAGGVPAGALLDLGDARPAIALGPDATVGVAYFEAGAAALALRTTGETTQAGLGLTITGPAIPASLSYVGETSAPLGTGADVAAHATRAGGTDLPGVVVRFTLGTESVDAVTGSDGIARAELPISGAVGPRELVVAAQPDGDPITVPFTVTANSVPVADAGGDGPGLGYTIGADSPLALAGSATDADPGEQATLAYQWDLDGDGAFDDASGPEPSLSSDAVRLVICGGVCEAGEVSTIALRVTDTKGGRGVDTATVTTVRDFGLTINPPSAVLVPNANVSFTVSVISTNGFTGPVTLSAPGLPTGITASFTPATVTPDGTTLLNLRAGPTFTPQDFDLVVRGTSGTIVREVGTDLSLEFGLVPQCFGHVTGRVVEQSSGLGIAGLPILGTTTDADGYYDADRLTLDTGNAPLQLTLTNFGAEYYPLSPGASVRIACGVTNTLDLMLLRRQYGAVVGTITGIDVDGSPLGPINNAQYALNRRTGPDGRYSFSGLPLGSDNSPTVIGVAASATGFHPTNGTVEISAGTTSTLDLTMRRVCTATVRVRVLDQRTGKVVPNAQVDFGPGSADGGFSDENGIVLLVVGLGAPDNKPVTRSVRARTPADVSPTGTATRTVTVGVCGAQVPVDVAIPYPHRSFATVSALVVDDTGAPIPDATIRIGTTGYSSNRTGADGRTTVSHLMGTDVPPTLDTVITAFATGYLAPVPIAIRLREDQTTQVTVTLVKRRFGAVAGTVRDRATGVPVAGVYVNGSLTGPDGRYLVENIALNGYNEPTQTNVSAFDQRNPPVYWSSPVTPVTVRPDQVTEAPDLLMIRVCAPATIRGRVIDAVTRAPIPDALVQAEGRNDSTDADGRFVITDVQVGNDNANREYTVRASKTGYVTAQKNVTIGCAADVVVDFGTDGDGFGIITGRVTDPGGAPVAQARITTGFGGAATTGSDGRYTINQAPAGEGGAARDWTVSVAPPAALPLETVTATATVRRDETTTLDFVLGELTDDAPVAASFAVTVDPGPTPITLAGADPTNDPLTFAVVTPPANGTLTGTAPNLVYTPNVGFVGVDTIGYTASDATSTSEPATITITVRGINQLPTAIVTGEMTVEEGTTANLTGATSSDPDGTIVAYAWDLDGDGAFDDDASADAFVYATDDGVVSVGLQVTDDRGGTGTTTADVSFTNAPPELELSDPDVSGLSIELFGEADDAGADQLTATIDLGDGSGPRPLAEDEFDEWLYVLHTYAAAGTYTIVVVVCDDDGGCTTAETTVTVGGTGPGNVAPTARITGADEAPEGGSIELSAATSSDPDGDVVAYAWDLDGDGQYDDGSGGTATVTSADDAVITVGLAVVDDEDAMDTTEHEVSFVNVEPAVGAFVGASLITGAPYVAAGSFTDPGTDAWTATVDWGAGAGPEALALDQRTFALAHTYATAGTYAVTVAVCDDDGEGCGSRTATVVVADHSEPPDDPSADLSVDKHHDGDATAGGALTYTIDVMNAGPDPATDVVVVDELPPGLALAGAMGTGWQCDEPTPGTVSCALDGDLAVGPAAPVTVEVTVDAAAPVGAGTIVNHASVSSATGDPDDSDDADDDPTTVVAAGPSRSDLAATVALSRTDPAPGEIITWTIAVTNSGPDDSGLVTVTVEVPTGLGYAGLGADGPQGFRLAQLTSAWTCTTTPGLVCTTPGIAPGASSDLALLFTVDGGAVGTLDGLVTVSSASDDPDPSNNSFPVQLVVAQVPPSTPAPTTPTTVSPNTSTTVPPNTPAPPPGSTVPAIPTTVVVAVPPSGTTASPAGGSAVPPNGQLPVTGGDSARPLDLAALLVALGCGLLLIRRMRTGPRASGGRTGR